jgi:hypothetical protein
MFHWGNKKNAEEKNVQDWKEEDKNLFSNFVKGRVDDFAFSITRRFLARRGELLVGSKPIYPSSMKVVVSQ